MSDRTAAPVQPDAEPCHSRSQQAPMARSAQPSKRARFGGPQVRGGVALIAVLGLTALIAACGVGKSAVAQGETFQFVSPGGKVVIEYNPPASRKPLRNFSGSDVASGNRISLGDFAGKIVVINIWASWCGPCIAESTQLEQAYAATKDKGVQFLGINFRDDRASAADFIANHHLTYPSIYDYSGQVMATWHAPISVVPTTLVIDRQHRAAAVFLRAVTTIDLLPVLDRLVAESTASTASTAAGAVSSPSGVPR